MRASIQPAITNASEDVILLLRHLERQRLLRIRGVCSQKASFSLNYTLMVLLPVLTTFFDHLAANDYGGDILRMEQLFWI